MGLIAKSDLTETRDGGWFIGEPGDLKAWDVPKLRLQCLYRGKNWLRDVLASVITQKNATSRQRAANNPGCLGSLAEWTQKLPE